MTTIDFPADYRRAAIEGWLGDAYADEFFILANERHDLVSSTPDRQVPDRETYIGTDIRWEWDTDLTPEQIAEFDEIRESYKAGMSKDRYALLKPAYSALKAYYINPSPTNAESVAAIKDIIGVLKVVLDDES